MKTPVPETKTLVRFCVYIKYITFMENIIFDTILTFRSRIKEEKKTHFIKRTSNSNAVLGQNIHSGYITTRSY